jgi:hypothetical protein
MHIQYRAGQPSGQITTQSMWKSDFGKLELPPMISPTMAIQPLLSLTVARAPATPRPSTWAPLPTPEEGSDQAAAEELGEAHQLQQILP